MNLRQFSRTAAMAAVLCLSGTGAALADEASIDTTGPNSNNQVTVNQNSNFTFKNDNNVSVENNNSQTAKSGEAVVNNNTVAGSAESGNASNVNAVKTEIKINNAVAKTVEECAACPGIPGEEVEGGKGGGVGAGAESPGLGAGLGAAMPAGGLGGGELAMLPGVGCSVICDVSSLRSGYGNDKVAAAVQDAKGLSAGLLGLAALLSLVGAGGSAAYAARRVKA